MEEKKPQPSPIPPADPESSSSSSDNAAKKLRKSKRRRICYSILAVFIILLATTILTLFLTYLRLESPKARFGQLTVGNSTTFIGNKRLGVEILVKNSNYVTYEFGPNPARLVSGGVIVGQFDVPGSRAKARSTGRVRITVEFSRPLIGDGDGDVVVVYVRGEIHGKVWVFNRVFIRRKTFNIDCNFSVNFLTNDVQRVTCR